MMKKSFCLILCLFSIAIANESERLEIASSRYLDFINRISVGEVFPQYEEAATIVSANCKKVFNGHLMTKNRDEFVSDLLSVYANYGSWKVIPLETIIANNVIVLRLLIECEKLGTHTAIVILHTDSNFLICEINEVFSRVLDVYDF